jgi:putative flippase GtrA
MTLSRRFSTELVKYTAVAVAGLSVDIGIGWFLANRTGMPIVHAAACGLIAGTLLNYVLHELWTFRGAHSRLSWRRAGLYGVVTLMTFASRLSVVALLASFASGPVGSLAVLVAAVGVSFTLNFLLSRRLFAGTGQLQSR